MAWFDLFHRLVGNVRRSSKFIYATYKATASRVLESHDRSPWSRPGATRASIRFKPSSSGFRVQGLGFRVQGLGFRV